MIPSLIGNFVGGGLFTGLIYWYLFLHGEDVPIHFDTTPIDTAVYEQGGPLHQEITATGAGTGYGNENGKGMLPDAGNKGLSGLARDFHARHFTKASEESSA